MRPSDRAERDRMAQGMATRLRAMRLAAGFSTMSGYARYLGLPVSTVRRCEAGRLIASRRVYALSMALAERTGMSLDWFIIGKGRSGVNLRRLCQRDPSNVVIFPNWRMCS